MLLVAKVCEGFSPPSSSLILYAPQLGVLQLHSILTPSTWSSCLITRLRGQSRLPPPLHAQTSDANLRSRSSPVLLTNQLKMGSSHNAFLGSIIC